MDIFDSIRFGTLQDVQDAIDNGDDVNALDYDAEFLDDEVSPPLNLACQFGLLYVVKLLIDSGADVNAKGEYGHTPLIIA